MILITGSSGFIGSNFVNYFLKNKIKFYGVDKVKSKYLKFQNFSKIDLIDKNKLEKLFKKLKPKIIIHLAADSGLNYCHNNIEKAFNNNLVSTFNLLTMCKKYKCKKFFFASSMAVENFELNYSYYGFTKFASENLIKSFTKNFEITGMIGRFSNIFGPYSSHKNSAIHEIIKCKLFKKRFNIHGTGNQQRDFLYVEDLVVKILTIIKSKNQKNYYLICTKKKQSINNVINIINLKFKVKLKTKHVKPPVGFDVSYSRKSKFFLSKNFYQKLEKTIKWYNNTNII